MKVPARPIDVFGGVVSLLCILHCLFFPVIGALSAIYGFTLLYEEKEIAYGFVLLALIVGIIAFGSGYLKHRQLVPVLLSAVGIVFIAAATQLTESAISAYAEPGLTILGGGLLITAHVINRRSCICPKDEGVSAKETTG